MTRLFTAVLLCLGLGCRSIEPVFDAKTDTRPNAEQYEAPRLLDDATTHELSRLPQIGHQATRDDRVQRASHVQSAKVLPPEPPLPESLPEPFVADASVAADALTLEQLVDMAMTTNPAVARAGARLGALRGMWIQVGLPPNPTLGYAGEDVGLEGSAGQQGGFVTQRFVRGRKLALNRAVVSQQIFEAEQRLAAVEQRAETDVRAGFYRVLIAQRQIDLARELLNISRQAVETSEALLRAREVSEVAVLQNSMQAKDAQILVRRAEIEYTAAWNHLAAIVGNPDMQSRPLSGDLEQPPDDLSRDDVLDRLLRQSPELAEAVAELSTRRMMFRRALAEVKTDVNVQVSVRQEAITDDVLTNVNVGVPIPIWDRNQGAVRQARAQIVEAERNIERLELQLRDRLIDEFKRYEGARYEVEMYSAEILPRARRSLDLVTRGYEQGEIGYLSQLAAQRLFFETNLSYMRAQRDLWDTRLRIEGLLLDDSLNDET